MASPARAAGAVKKVTIGNLLLHVFDVTSGATAAAINHDGPSTPLAVWGVCKTVPTSAGYGLTASSATTITLDFVDDGNDTWTFYCLFNEYDAQDRGSIASDNDS